MSPYDLMMDRGEDSLFSHLIQHFGMVDKAINDAILSLQSADHDLARTVINNERNINSKHHQVENECVAIIARIQPASRELRELLADMHISAQLDRIADYASSIANIVTEMSDPPQPEIRDSVCKMGNDCRDMLDRIKNAYETRDIELAYEVAKFDDSIDKSERDLIAWVFDHQNDNPKDYQSSTRLLWITHSLERMGDRITNIAERIVFVVTGEKKYLN